MAVVVKIIIITVKILIIITIIIIIIKRIVIIIGMNKCDKRETRKPRAQLNG